MFRTFRQGRNFSQSVEIRDSLSGALDIRTVSIHRQPYEWNQCTENNGGCSHLCLFRGIDYICACPDRSEQRDLSCSTVPRNVVPPQKTEQTVEYPDEATELDGLLPNDKDFDDEEYRMKGASRRETLILIAIGVVIVLLIISLAAIICK